MATTYNDTQIAVVDASGNISVIHPRTKASLVSLSASTYNNVEDALSALLVPLQINDTLTYADSNNVRFYRYSNTVANNPVGNNAGVILNIPLLNAKGAIKILVSENSRIFTNVYIAGVSYGSWTEH